MIHRVVDIETCRNTKARDFFHKKTYKPPANYKDEETISKWIKEKREKDIEKAALHWWSGCIVCIGFGWGKNNIMFSLRGREGTLEQREKMMLCDFFDELERNANLLLFGKSSKDFDFPYIIGRAMAHDIGIPQALRFGKQLDIVDIDHAFSYSRSCSQVGSLDSYAWGLGIASKSAKATDVAAWVESEDWDAIESYCSDDLRITEEMFKRYLKIYTGGSYDSPLFDD